MLNFISDFYKKYKEIIKYLFFGGLTTVVNFVVYFIFANLLGIDKVISNVISWFFSVIFAFVTNKIFVFDNTSNSIKNWCFEFAKFFGCRVFSGVLDTGLFALFVNVLHFNDFIVKIFTQILVVILNYFFSKLIIFKKSKKEA